MFHEHVAVTQTFLASSKEISMIPLLLLLLSQVDLDILQQQGLASRVAAERMRADMDTLVCAQEAKALEVEAKLDAEEERLGRGAARLDADEARWVTMEQQQQLLSVVRGVVTLPTGACWWLTMVASYCRL